MLMAFYLSVLCSMLLFVSSTVMPKRPEEYPERLYFKSAGECLAFRSWSGIGNYNTVAAMAVLYYVFR